MGGYEMIPYKCQTIHKPEFGQFGDCLRACVASVLELTPPNVPHFLQNGNAAEGEMMLQDFLAGLGLGFFQAFYPAEATLSEVLNGISNHAAKNVCVLLFCSVNGGNHVVIAQNGAVIHDPAFYPSGNYQATDAGYWVAMVLTKL